MCASQASALKALHRPGAPLVLANVYDLASLFAVLQLNKSLDRPVKAIATASFAIAESQGIRDEDLTLADNLAAIAKIAPATRAADLPLTVDLQDAYGESLEFCVSEAIKLGAAGANIEDSVPCEGFANGVDKCLYPMETQVARLGRALKVAVDLGVGDFVINARTDVMRLDPLPANAMEETIRRGKAYLGAGATTVFVWGGPRGLRDAEVATLVKEFGGRVNVKLSDREDALSVAQLAEMGVARISVGPSLWRRATEAIQTTASRILAGGKLHG